MRTLAEKRRAANRLDSVLPVAAPPDAIRPDAGAAAALAVDDAPVPQPESSETTAVGALVETLAELGVEQAFGVSGGAIALLFDALQESSIELHHFRHETGAAFAAAEAYFARRKPVVVFATTGPGTLNSLTGLTAGRFDGAKVILVTGATGATQRGRWATQETSPYTMPQDALYTKGAIFDFAARIERASELAEVRRRLALGVSRPGGFIAHVAMPMAIQSQRVSRSRGLLLGGSVAPAPSPDAVAEAVRLLKQGPFGSASAPPGPRPWCVSWWSARERRSSARPAPRG